MNLPDDTVSSLSRRGLVCAALIAPPLQAAAMAARSQVPADGAAAYLAALSEHLELHVTRSVQLKVKTALSLPEQQQILRTVYQRLQQVIGPAFETARETIGACVADDLIGQRSKDIHGLSFAQTELAMLLVSRSDD